SSEIDKYHAIIYKSGLPSDIGRDPLDWLRKRIEPHEIKVQHYKNRIGNNEGFNLLDHQEENTSMMKKMEDQLLEIKGLVESLQEKNLKLEKDVSNLEKDASNLEKDLLSRTEAHISLRRGVLEERRIFNRNRLQKDRKTTSTRNDIAHGGDILGDIKAIQYVEAQGWGYVAEYKEDFQQAYTISFYDASTRVPLYPQEAIRAFNILASIRELHAWQSRLIAADREIIEKLAMEITKIAQSAREDELSLLREHFKNNGDVQEKFNEMSRLFLMDRR
ncbi:hypothetical protein FQN57_004554, partial [Myotisia sp. PD_48]